jgi:hypothetical protein
MNTETSDAGIRAAERRAHRYFYEDGLTEIALGIVFLLLGGYFFAEVFLAEGTLLKTFLDAGFVLLIVSAGFIVGRVIRYLKLRITYPRTGYVSYKKKALGPGRRWAAMLLSTFVAGALAVLFASAPSFQTWMPAINGLCFGAAAFLIARRTEVGRFYAFGAVSVIIGLALALANLGGGKGLGFYYAFSGGVLIISGVAALAVYLRRSRIANEHLHES